MIEQFPNANGRTISEYANDVFKDPHALDTNTVKRRYLENFIKKKYGAEDLQLHGFILNDATSTVFSKGVFAFTNEFVGLSKNLATNMEVNRLKKVFVFENRNTADRLIARGIDIPFIIGDGWPNTAVKSLLDRLSKSYVPIYYHGDMDYAGINIADFYVKNYHAKLPFMTVSEFEDHCKPAPKEQNNFKKKAQKDLSHTLLPIRICIDTQKSVVYEEDLDVNRLLDVY